MTWENFSYVCRRVQSSLQASESTNDCINRITHAPATALYASNQKFDTLTRGLLAEIGEIQNHNKAKEVTGIYSHLNLNQASIRPMQFKRATIYLSYLTFIFLFVSAIYAIYVVPSFGVVFKTLDIETPVMFSIYSKYSVVFFPIIIFLLVVSLFLGFALKNLFSFEPDAENNFLLRILAAPGIRQSFKRIIEILRYPVVSANQTVATSNSAIQQHLTEIRNSDLCLTTEMQTIINLEINALAERCETQMRYITIVIALILIAAIFYFVMGAYSPIFLLGDNT